MQFLQNQLGYEMVQVLEVTSSRSCILHAPSSQMQASHSVKKLCETILASRSVLQGKRDSFSFIGLPVGDSDFLRAVLYVETRQKEGFSPTDCIILENVAAQLAVLMNNQAAYGALQLETQVLQDKCAVLEGSLTRPTDRQQHPKKRSKAFRIEPTSAQMIGDSPAIRSLLTLVDKVAPTTASILIHGETGTGKELIARRLHLQSPRHSSPYVTVNCSALQESLLESELFGHEKGSFTGAVQQKVGLCELAHGGSLFLDEIGELSLPIQAKLLRFLQEGEFYRIGGKQPIQVDVRVMSATHRNLEKEIQEGRFREDLFYRLNTITLQVPALRKRREDIPLLVDFFLSQPGAIGAALQKRLHPEALDAFLRYAWPGNIRELQNHVERFKILVDHAEIQLSDLPKSFHSLGTDPQAVDRNERELSLELPLEDVEKNHILRSLAYHRGNKTRAAQSLGITIKTLYNKLHRYGMGQDAGGHAHEEMYLSESAYRRDHSPSCIGPVSL